jgi:hypothetical protein
MRESEKKEKKILRNMSSKTKMSPQPTTCNESSNTTVCNLSKYSVAKAPMKCYTLTTRETENYFSTIATIRREGSSFETEVGQQEELFDGTLASRFILEVLLYKLTRAAGRDAVAGRCHGEASTLRTVH